MSNRDNKVAQLKFNHFQHKDVAIITMAKSVPANMADHVKPICLDSGNQVRLCKKICIFSLFLTTRGLA